MEIEKEHELPRPPNPPDWWHEAIRKFLPGSQLSPSQFETFENVAVNGLHYIIQSLTKGCEKDGYTEGVFIEASVPIARQNEIHELIFPVVTTIRDVLKNSLKLTRSEYEITGLEDDPEFLGVISKLDRKTAIGLALYTPRYTPEATKDGYLKSIASAHPVPDADMKKDAKRILAQKYFIEMSLFDRIPLVLKPSLEPVLKSAILTEESRISDMAIQGIMKENGFAQKDLEILRSDAKMQDIYATLLKTMQNAVTPNQKENAKKALNSLEPILIAGFLDYYKRYWEKRPDFK